MHKHRELVYFGLIGTAAFVVDATILHLVKDVFGVYLGRVLSFSCAVFFTWILNRNLTFKQVVSDKPLFSEFAQYFLVMLGGGTVNYLSYVLLVISIDAVKQQPIWGVAVGSFTGFLVNFTCAKIFVFKPTKHHPETDVLLP